MNCEVYVMQMSVIWHEEPGDPEWLIVAKFIGNHLVAGAAEQAGAMIFTAVLHKFTRPEMTIEQLYRNIVIEFRQMLTEELTRQFDQAAFEEALHDFQVASISMSEYVRIKKGSTLGPEEKLRALMQKLHDAEVASKSGYVRLVNSNPFLALHTFPIVAGLHLAILQEYYTYDRAYKKIMIDWIEGPLPQTLSFNEYISKHNDYFLNRWIPSRFSSGCYETMKPWLRQIEPGSAPVRQFPLGTIVTYHPYFSIDGKKYDISEYSINVPTNNEDITAPLVYPLLKQKYEAEAEATKNDRVRQLQKEFSGSNLKPLVKLLPLWRGAVAKSR